jgi:hypothetical protein
VGALVPSLARCSQGKPDLALHPFLLLLYAIAAVAEVVLLQ